MPQRFDRSLLGKAVAGFLRALREGRVSSQSALDATTGSSPALFHQAVSVAAAVDLAMMSSTQGGTVNSSLTLRPSARVWANRRWWASDGRPPQIRQGCLATDLICSRSRIRRGSGRVSKLLSMSFVPRLVLRFASSPFTRAAPRRYRALWCRLRVVRRRRDHKRPKLSLEGLLHTLGIWRDQPVLIGEASARPRCRVIGGAKIVEFGEEPIRQFCRRLRCEKRFDRFRVPGSP